MPDVTALCGQLVLILDTATSQGLLVPQIWAGPIPTLNESLVQTRHFPFLFPEMRQFLFNSQYTEVLLVQPLEAILSSCVGEAHPLLLLGQVYLPTRVISQWGFKLFACHCGWV